MFTSQNNVSIEDNLLKVFTRKVNDLMGLKSRYPHLSQVFFLCQVTKAQRFSWAVSPEWSPCYRFPLPKEWQIKALSERAGSECSDHFRRKCSFLGKGTNAVCTSNLSYHIKQNCHVAVAFFLSHVVCTQYCGHLRTWIRVPVTHFNAVYTRGNQKWFYGGEAMVPTTVTWYLSTGEKSRSSWNPPLSWKFYLISTNFSSLLLHKKS